MTDANRHALLRTLRQRGFQEDDFGDWYQGTLTVKVDPRGQPPGATCGGVTHTYASAQAWVIAEADKLDEEMRQR